MNKKGQTIDDFYEKTIAFIFIFVAVFATIFLVDMYIDNKTDVNMIQAEVFFNKIMYSPDLFWLDDELGNPQPGIISMENFNDEFLNSWISYEDDSFIAAKLHLFTQDGESEKIIYYDKIWYERWEPIANSGILGLGSVRLYRKRIPVTYVKDEWKGGILEVKIIVPNR